MTAHQAGDIVLERFRLERPLASGAMGEVWAGEDTDSRMPVAVKLAVGRGAERSEREARALESLDHPGVVRFLAAGEDRGARVLVMELLDGVPLAAHIGAQSPPEVPEAIALAQQLAEALVHAHERGVVHRDVKASNAVVVRRDGRDQLVLIDFGLSLVEGSPRISSADVVLGSSHTMPPEQVQGMRAGPLADIYSLGALTFRMVCGRYPFHASSPVQVLAMHAHAKVPRLAQRARRPVRVPLGLEGLLTEMLAKQPSERPDAQKVADRLAALAAVPKGRWVDVVPELDGDMEPSTPPPPSPPGVRRGWMLGAAVLAVLALAALGSWWLLIR